ncbi:hypothetical protein ACFFMP_03080 [Pseudoroseomonas cervicalis]|uniref:hypothetical protein n=1 Tax=Teichococcus cervicalis TaxID=204525 RepID=UPI0035EA25C5
MARDAIGTILGQRRGHGLARAAGLALLAGLTGCGAASLTGPRDAVPTDSLTAQRILGQPVEVPPLLPAVGNVWPEGEETRRATLADPEVRPADPLSVPQPLPRQQRGSSTRPTCWRRARRRQQRAALRPPPRRRPRPRRAVMAASSRRRRARP